MNQHKTQILPVLLSLVAIGCANPYSGSSSGKLCMSRSEAQNMLYQASGDTQAEAMDFSGQSFLIRMKNSGEKLQAMLQDLKETLGQDAAIQTERINDQLIRLDLPRDSRSLSVLNEYINSDDIEFLEPDYQIQNSVMFNDPMISKQWAHTVIQSEKAWNISQGANVLVGVIDSGIDLNHPDLKPNIFHNTRETANGVDDDHNGYVDDVNGWNFAYNNNNVMADDTRSYHGTHVSGTIGAVANNGVGGVGHAPKVKILPLKYLNSSGSGYTSNAIKAIDYAVSMGVKILSNSWGSFTPSGALQNAIRRAAQKGVLFVAASGNGDASGRGVNLDRTGFYPAAFPEENILSVAASNSADQLVAWSNYGATRVDLAAPGMSIWSTSNGNSYKSLSGTSMATPLVSAVAALVWSAHPDFSYKDVKKALMASVDRVGSMAGKLVSGGRINAYKALQYAATQSKQPISDSDEASMDEICSR